MIDKRITNALSNWFSNFMTVTVVRPRFRFADGHSNRRVVINCQASETGGQETFIDGLRTMTEFTQFVINALLDFTAKELGQTIHSIMN